MIGQPDAIRLESEHQRAKVELLLEQHKEEAYDLRSMLLDKVDVLKARQAKWPLLHIDCKSKDHLPMEVRSTRGELARETILHCSATNLITSETYTALADEVFFTNPPISLCIFVINEMTDFVL